LGAFVIAALVSPWTLLIIPVFFIISGKFVQYALEAMRQTTRISKVANSPVLSFIGETISGSSTIRAFKRQSQFIEKAHKLLNNCILSIKWKESINNWFYLRLAVLSVSLMLIAGSFCIIYRHETDPVLLSMCFVYVLTLADKVMYTVYLLFLIESRMVAVDRCFKVLDIE